MNVQVTVVVATYNPNMYKLEKTLQSILAQKKIDFDIIVTDDGSRDNCFDKVKEFFEKNDFTKYQLIHHEQNVGTCKNMKSAVDVAKGKYVKLISPGDYLYDDCTLSDWYEFMEDNDAQISFGDGVYYRVENNNIKILKELNHPQRLTIYDKKELNFNSAKMNYILLCDTAVGATFMATTDIMNKYFGLIVDKVKYAEDFMYKIMLVDGIQLRHFAKPVIWYEYGAGISTGNNDKWTALIKKDQDAVDEIIISRNNDKFTRKYNKYLEMVKDGKKSMMMCKMLAFPTSFYWLVVSKMKKTFTVTQVKLDFINKLLDN